jgi:hypothetical protein
MPWHRAGVLLVGYNPSDPSDVGDLILDGANTEINYDPTSRYAHGLVWHYEDPDSGDASMASHWSNGDPQEPSAYHKINGGGNLAGQDIFNLKMYDLPVGLTEADLARPSSAHTDGVNIGLADGTTRFINSSIDVRVYQAMLTPRGKSSDVPWPEFVLTDELE